MFNKKNRFSVFIFILLLCSILGCTQNRKTLIENDSNTDSINDSGLDTLINKEIFFPEHLSVFKNNKKLSSFNEYYSSIKSKLKIVSIFDAECGTCIINLNKVDSIFHIHELGTAAELIFILNVTDSVYFTKLLSPLLKVNSVVLWDTKNHSFERLNNILLPDNNLRTFMLNRENKIFLIGNPLIQKEIEQKYWDAIKL